MRRSRYVLTEDAELLRELGLDPAFDDQPVGWRVAATMLRHISSVGRLVGLSVG